MFDGEQICLHSDFDDIQNNYFAFQLTAGLKMFVPVVQCLFLLFNWTGRTIQMYFPKADLFVENNNAYQLFNYITNNAPPWVTIPE